MPLKVNLKVTLAAGCSHGACSACSCTRHAVSIVRLRSAHLPKQYPGPLACFPSCSVPPDHSSPSHSVSLTSHSSSPAGAGSAHAAFAGGMPASLASPSSPSSHPSCLWVFVDHSHSHQRPGMSLSEA